MTARASIHCTYPACRCIATGPHCIPARREDEMRRIEARKAQEPFCSHCGLAESDLDLCESDVCITGEVEMIAPAPEATP